MAEDIEWIPPGHRSEEKAWAQVIKDYPPNNELLASMRKAGINIKVGVRKRGAKYYAVIIKQR